MEQAASVFNHSVHTAHLSQADHRSKTPSKTPHQKRDYDYFYVIGVPEKRLGQIVSGFPVVNSPVKIGYSKNPWARTTDLKATVCKDMELLACVRVVPNARAKIKPYFRKAGKKPNWYFMDNSVKSLIIKINNETFTGLDNWIAPPIYGKWLRKLSQPAATADPETNENETDSDEKIDCEKLTTKQNHTNNINKNNDIENKKQPEHEDSAVFSMFYEWEPWTNAQWLLQRNGVKLEPSKKVEFILYWMRRPDVKRTQAHWEHSLMADLRKLEARRKKEARREAAIIERAAQLIAKAQGKYGGGKRSNPDAVTTVAWPQAFKAFEKETTVVTEEARRKNQAAQVDHMRQAMASLGMRRKKE